MRWALLLSAILLISCQARCHDRINLLLIGQVVPETCPLPYWFESEPAATFTLVPTKIIHVMRYDEARRQVRLYFPRTRSLTWEYDFFMYVNPYFEPFSASQIEYMHSAIEQGGSGGFQTLGGITIDSAEPNHAWLQSSLAAIFPNDPTAIELWRQLKPWMSAYNVILEKDDDLPPVLTPFLDVGIERVPGSRMIPLAPQQGAIIWARGDGAFPKVSGQPFPFLMSWQVREGMTWSVANDLDLPWWSGVFAPSEQEYGLDILMNIILHSLGRPVAQDVVLVNAVRRDLRAYKTRVSTINAFVDFIERFGARSDGIVEDMLESDDKIDTAMVHYMEGRYDEALGWAEEAHASLMEFERWAMRLKDQALLWVYLTEWAAVSGTALLGGYVLYTVMIRKRLYRQVQVTRLGRSEGG